MIEAIKNIWRKKPTVSIVVIALAAFVFGLIIRGGGPQPLGTPAHDHAAGESAQAEVWTCSMHPNIRQPGPGSCPICGMDLIPVTADAGEDTGPREVKLSATARKLAEIQTAPVERKNVAMTIRLAGKIATDETRERKISAWVPGRLERLFVEYTGETVKKGDPLVELYSPELLTAQQELLAAVKVRQVVGGSRSENVIETARRTVEAAREKLRRWGLTGTQISEIEQRGTPAERTTIYAPTGGTVTHKNAVEGMYVQTGAPIYTIADLSHLWVMLDAYEADLTWIENEQQVDFTTKAFPGETFTGTVAFIDPLVDPATRAIKIRVELPNRGGKLKPGMFVRAAVEADASGNDPAGMPLTVPATAPLITGTRAVVYVELPGDEGRYEGREILLGPRAGDSYIVRSGLSEGEMVVVNGAFKIDSEIQILAKPSMMSPDGGAAPAHQHEHGALSSTPMETPTEYPEEPFAVPEVFQQQIAGVFAAYFETQDALSHDKFDTAKTAAGNLMQALEAADMGLLSGPAHQFWMAHLTIIRESAQAISSTPDIAAARIKFEPLSDAMYAIALGFGAGGADSVFRIHCPMAFNNRGAGWLQTSTGVENPYFGSKMFKCGVVKDTILAGHMK